MKHLKRLGLVAIAAAAVMALGASTASATILTSPAGTQVPITTVIKGELKEGEWVLKSPFIGEVKCSKSTFEYRVDRAGTDTTTVSGPLLNLTFANCNCTVAVLSTGALEIHTEGANANGNGTVTAFEQEITTECFGLHCVFATTTSMQSTADVGKLVGGTPAVWEASGELIVTAKSKSGGFCGSHATETARYKVTSPGTLIVD